MVRELLCFGWIDSKGRRVDQDRTSLLVCPRRPGSGWSRVNKEHLVLLRREGRIQPAGQAAIERAVADGSWTRLDEVETLREPDDLSAALDAAPDARGHGDVFPRSARRAILEWIASAKTEPTRDRRITRTVEEAASGRRANQWRQPKS
ncbi:MAG: YdeI/OmpD-associated family protein [Ornithinimicrobium sp.]|uniref:YdeI/OmpD-associated family protein n=1 Tax=Ornithinimicrobium sp. TaxID=1977084 RepID=UPI003D9B89FF